MSGQSFSQDNNSPYESRLLHPSIESGRDELYLATVRYTQRNDNQTVVTTSIAVKKSSTHIMFADSVTDDVSNPLLIECTPSMLADMIAYCLNKNVNNNYSKVEVLSMAFLGIHDMFIDKEWRFLSYDARMDCNGKIPFILGTALIPA